ncbi:MAG: bile acid:sodium symporter family protein [Aquificaceae bacterium]|nr:bile acid:sodium symporter family protein [Aquificaceae bacterium]
MEPILTFLIVLLFSFLGIYAGDLFVNLKPAIVPMLAFVMLFMGLTLKPQDFTRILKKPFSIAYAGVLQYSIMPLLGYSIANALKVDVNFLYGAVLVGTAPGGTASNLITYLSRGDVAYSVSMTTFSTLLSPILTPLLTYMLIGKKVEVPLWDMVRDLLLIILMPVVFGLFLRRFLLKSFFIERLIPYLVAVFIGVIIAIVLALNAGRLKDVGFSLLVLVILHNLLGFFLGYVLGLFVGLDRRMAKTLSIEVGMQNSGLAVVLAVKYFSPLSALPGALFSLFQNLNGLLLSLIYRRI